MVPRAPFRESRCRDLPCPRRCHHALQLARRDDGRERAPSDRDARELAKRATEWTRRRHADAEHRRAARPHGGWRARLSQKPWLTIVMLRVKLAAGGSIECGSRRVKTTVRALRGLIGAVIDEAMAGESRMPDKRSVTWPTGSRSVRAATACLGLPQATQQLRARAAQPQRERQKD